MRLKKGFTILLVILFFATLILSLTFIAENSDHECTGHDCVICQIMETAEEIIGGGKSAETSAANLAANQFNTESQPVSEKTDGSAISTPVLLHDLLTI